MISSLFFDIDNVQERMKEEVIMSRKTRRILITVMLVIVAIVLCVTVYTAFYKDRKNIKDIIDADSAYMKSGSAMIESSMVSEGTMEVRVKDAFITDNLTSGGLELDKVVPYSHLELIDEDGAIQWLTEPDFYKDTDTGDLLDGCFMYVVQLEVTNIDAVSSYAEYYNNDYLFRADNLRLCYVDNDAILSEQNIAYYSLISEGEHTWSTYELKPGETISYEVGYFVGNAIKQSARSDTRDLIKNPITEIDESKFCLIANGTKNSLLRPEWRHVKNEENDAVAYRTARDQIYRHSIRGIMHEAI